MRKIVIASLATLALATASMAAAPSSCIGCHGANGEKNTMVKESKPNTMSKADIKTALAGYKAGTLNKYGKGAVMKGFAGRMTDAEVADTVDAWGK
ncbi:MAG: cytochrome C [Sulfurimonas sp.]|nr:cytochrome C [Sulfurimonas sp.]